jgi:hypothetical protein
MTNIDCTEVAHLTGALDRMRATFRFKADDLDTAGLQARIGASSLTLGGLLKHLAVCEDYMFTVKLAGEPLGAPWEGADWEADSDWEINSAAGDTRSSSTTYLMAPLSGRAPGSAGPWRTAVLTSPCTCPAPRASTPACAG